MRGIRRTAIVVSIVVGLSVAVPAGAVPSGGGFPLSWLTSWLSQGRAWARSSVVTGLPRQPHGPDVGRSGYVSANATHAGGGAGGPAHKVAGGLDGYQPHEAGAATTATTGTHGYDAKTSRRDATRSTARMDQYVNADGSVTRQLYQDPVNYQAADGTWQPIDTKLARGSDGRWHVGANSTKVSMRADAAATGDHLVSVTLPTGQTVGYDIQGGSVSSPAVSGDTATYRSVLPDTDLRLTTVAGGVQENLVLNSPQAASDWVFPLSLQGLTPRLASDGSVDLVDASGAVAARFPHGYMQDSKFNPQTGAMAGSGAVSFSLVTVDGSAALKVSADRAWLADPARVYPVIVDPTVSIYTNGDVFLDNDPDTTNTNGDNIAVGTYDSGTTKARSFIRFDNLSSNGVSGKRVTSASLKLYHTWSYDCLHHLPINVYRVLSNWDVNSLATAAPSVFPGPSLSSSIGSLTITDNYPACLNTAADRTVGQWWSVPLGVSTFNDWTSGGTNYGLAIVATESDSYGWKRFTSANASGTYGPSLVLTYTDNVLPQVDTRYPNNNAVVETLTPELVARAHDPDGYPNKGLKYQFVVYDSTGATPVASSGWVTTSTWTVPSGSLKWNTSYLYTVQVNDMVGVSAWYPAYAFSTPVPQPAFTSSLTQNPGKGYDPSTGNYTTSAVDAQVAGVGPALEISRSYNSLDTRRNGAFGQGWSSILDTRATQKTDAAGVLQTVVVTYPSGQEVAFGRNADGSFTPPSGRYATFSAITSGSTVTGYTLTDKDATVYTFGRAAGGGVFTITAVTDANGRTLTFGYDSTTGLVSTMTSASGRRLTLTWATTVSPVAGPHVATVTTDAPTAGGTGYTWTYSYTTYDRLTSACPPGTTTACTTYDWASWVDEYDNAVLNSTPSSYWRLSDTSGSSTKSYVLANAGVDNGVYKNVALGGAGPFSNSTATSATFDGSSSYVQLPGNLIMDGSYQTISLWFKTTATNGVLFSYQNKAITAGAPNSITPALYVDSNGYLRGEFWYGDDQPMISTKTVNDGAWHQAVLAGNGDTQSLYLDGAKQATINATITVYLTTGAAYEYLGAGYIGWGWPDNTYSGASPQPMYFSGQIANAALYNRALTSSTVNTLYWIGQMGSSVLSKITRPSGRVAAQIAMDRYTGRVRSVTDENGGVWSMGTPTVVGDSDVYEAALLGSNPQDYWRMGDVAGTTDAVDEVSGNTASYAGTLTFGAAGPFSDSTSVTFDGSSSVLQLPPEDIPAATAAPGSWSLWFKTSSTAGGVLVGFQSNPLGSSQSNYVPILYIGTDGKLRGTFCYCAASAPMTSSGTVNDGKWHQVTLTRSATAQALYLDGNSIGTKSASSTETRTLAYGQVGAGTISTSWPSTPTNTSGYFNGSIAEAAYFDAQLSADDVTAQFSASKQTVGVALTTVDTTVKTIPMPVKVVTVTDPGGKTVSYSYDLVNGGREVSETDALGNTTRFGYDTGGFTNLVYDPNGAVTQTVQDARGNTIQQITCQDQSANKCSSVYYEYYLNASSLTDPRNDLMTSMRDGRSASATDNTYKTTYAFDAKGNPTTTTDPLGRVNATTYTDGTSVAAYDSGFAPPGLPSTVVNAAGGTQSIVYYASGDVAKVTSPAGATSTYTYDKLGRKLSETVVTSTYPAGRTTTFGYDAQNRVLTQTSPEVTNRVTGAKHVAVVTDVYDDDGNMTSQTTSDGDGADPARTELVTYNAYGQKQSQTDAVGKTVSFTYDAYGHVVTETDSDGGQTRYDLDAEGNVLKTWMVGYTGNPNNPTAPTDTVLESSQYDPAGRLATQTDAMGWTTSYAYTDNGLTAKVTRSDGTNTFVTEQDQYDGAGNIVTTISNNGTTTTTFKYDAAGRRYQTSLDPNGLNRSTVEELSADDQVVSRTSMTGTSTVLARTDWMYDAEGHVLAQTAYNGDPSVTPIGRWKLNETSGTTAADSAGNNAVSTSNVTWSTDATRGAVAAFNGTSSAITSYTPPVDTTRAYTVSAWANLASKAADSFVMVIPGGGGGSAFKLNYIASADRWYVSGTTKVSDGTVSWFGGGTPTGSPKTGTWTFLTATVDPANKAVKLYADGALQVTIPWTNPFNNHATGMNIGVEYNTGYFNGALSDVQVYQSALSASQIANIYSGAAPASSATVSRTSYTVNNGGLVTAERDPNGNVTNTSYDEEDRPVVSTAAQVNAETFNSSVTARPVTYVGYDTFGDQTETVDGNGNRTVHVFDRAGREYETHLPSYTPPGSSTPITPVTSKVYDVLGQVTSSTDALGRTTSYVYDQLGRVAKVTTPGGAVSTATYDMLGNQLSATDPTGAVSSTTYDYLGHKATATQAVRQSNASYTTNYAYNSAGLLQQETSPAGVKQSYTYNVLGEPLTVTDGAGQVTSYAYDGLGRRYKTTAPDNTYSTVNYDMLGRANATADYAADGTAQVRTYTGYDAAGNAVSSTDGRGTTTTFTYDPTGLVLSERQPISSTDSIVTSFGYDLAGNRTRFSDGRGNAFWTTYNSWNLPESRIEPATTAYSDLASRTYTATYDAAGQATSQAQPGGVVQTYTYDNDGRLLTQAGSGAEASTDTRSFGYDAAGRVTSLSAPGGTETVSYDDRGLPLSLSGPVGASSFGYNADGSMTSRTDTAGTTNYTYDTAGRLSTVKNTAAAVDVGYAYNAMSAVSKITYGGTGNTRTIGYDSLHRLTSDEMKTAGGVSIAKIAYGWDANGNETAKTTTNFNGTTTANTYTYDLADRLTSWNNGTTTTGYAYDKSGNRTQDGTKSFAYDERNRLLSDSTGVAYMYTARGTLSATLSGATTLHTTADAFGQIVSQEASTGTQTYSYDALGRAVRAGFTYTGLGNDLSGDGTATYVRDPSGDVVGEHAGSTNRLAWTDLHDDVVGQFTATSTTLDASTTYDPLGKVLAAAAMIGNLGYQSEWTDGITNRVNMLARWYNTDTGQFDSEDTASNNPVPDSVNANRYQYGDANPLTVTDPSGHWGWGWVKKAASAVSHAVSSVASSAYSMAYSAASYAYYAASYAYHATAYVVDRAASAGLGLVSKAASSVGLHKLARAAERGRKHFASRAQKQLRQAKRAAAHAKQAGHALKAQVARHVKTFVKNVKDAAHKTAKWVKEHKNTLIEVAAVVATVAATVALGPVGGVLVGVAINVAKDAAEGKIHSLSDLGASVVSGAVTGVLGAATGGVGGLIGGKIAGMVAGKVGANLLGRVVSGAVGGALSGGIADVGQQLLTKGSVNWRETAMAAGTGAVIGGIAGGRAKAGGCGHSFDPDTRVLMADGTTRPIKDVKPGDKVTSTDPATGTNEAKQVTLLHNNHDSDLADVTVKDSKTGKSTVLHTTWHHPFWNADAKAWTEAADLKPGTHLRAADGETAQQVTAVKIWTGLHWMRDLTVADTHTYYVVTESTPVLVHNCGDGEPLPKQLFKPGRADTDNEPQAALPKDAVVHTDGQGLRDGDYHYAAMKDGSVRAMHSDDIDAYNDQIPVGQPAVGHTSFTDHEPVHMAGHFNVSGGKITDFDNWSGHYMPHDSPGFMPIEDVGRQALVNNGFPGAATANWDDITK